ncbi:hypothetical protein IGI37_000921 [Enterococcus sp. AZ194]|uniref:SMI1/KNR4 family protein n=1 Tax=Enterococcus sp. AZ194 TaxID=2774629 RepID=UPI003F1F5DD0
MGRDHKVFVENNIQRIGEESLSIDEINNFIHISGAKLPEDYQQWLLKYNGVKFLKCPKFKIPFFNDYFELETLFALEDSSPQHKGVKDAWWYNKNYSLDASCLVIGEVPNTGNGYLAIVLITDEEGFSGVCALDLFYDEPYFPESSEETGNLYKISESFDSFINHLTM